MFHTYETANENKKNICHYEKVTQNNDLSYDFVSHYFELLSHYVEILSHHFEIVSHSF